MGENKTEVLDLAEQVRIEFIRLYKEYKVADAPERRVPDMIDAIWSEIYKIVFKLPESEMWINSSHTRLRTWRYKDVDAVSDMYINLCRVYGGKIKINSFCELTGIHRYTLDLWHNKNTGDSYIFDLKDGDIDKENNNIYININSETGKEDVVKGDSLYNESRLNTKRVDVKKKIVEAERGQSRNARSIDTVGNIQMSNNDEELGFLYDTKRDIRKESIKQVISVSDLPKLGIPSSNCTMERLTGSSAGDT